MKKSIINVREIDDNDNIYYIISIDQENDPIYHLNLFSFLLCNSKFMFFGDTITLAHYLFDNYIQNDNIKTKDYEMTIYITNDDFLSISFFIDKVYLK